jgi:hypothetical protein
MKKFYPTSVHQLRNRIYLYEMTEHERILNVLNEHDLVL